ncbi:MAG: AAA family ATPase [Chloroflexota bacterium]
MNDDSLKSSRSWDVLLLGGPSGAGKTSVSYRLAQHFGAGLLEIDDFQAVLQEMTTPQQQPLLHIWATRPEIHAQSAELIFDQILAIADVITPALEAVIAKHLRSHRPVILDGDLILPSLLAEPSFAGKVRGVFLYEENESQLIENFARREPGSVQTKRARVSWLYGQWLLEEAERTGITLLPARPWETVFERIVASLK